MTDQSKTKQALIRELVSLRQKIAELEQSDSERARGLRALQESQGYFEAIIQNASDIILVVDKKGTITYASPSVERFLGYEPDELIGKRTLDLIVSDDKPRGVADFGRALLTKEVPIPNVFRVRHKDGTERILEGVGKNLLDNPIVAGFVMNVRDITDRKRIEDEMVIVTEIGRVIGATLDIGKVYEQMVAEIKKRIPFDSLRVNLINHTVPKTMDVAYVSGLDIPGRRVGDSYPMQGTVLNEVIRTRRGMVVESENPKDLTDRFPSLIVSVQAGMRSIMTIPLISRDELIGTLVLRSKKPVAYTEQDLSLAERIGMQIAGAIANAKLYSDLSASEKSLRESEERFRSLFEQAAVGVAEIDINTSRFLTVNRRLCEMVGRTEEELLATTFQAITHPEDTSLDMEKREMLLAGKINRYGRVKRYLRKDGGIIWVHIMISFLGKPGEKFGRNMIVVEDITERKRAEEARHKSEEEAKRLAWKNAIMAEIGRIVSSSLDIDEVYDRFSREMAKLVSFDRIVINAIDLEKRTTCVAYATGIGVPDRQSGVSIPLTGTVTAECLRTRSSMLIQPESIDECTARFPGLLPTFQAGLRSIILAPLISRDQFIGALTLRSFKQKAYSDEDVRLTERVANQIAGAIANAQLFTERRQAEKQLQDTLESLRKAVGTTIQVISSTVEARDPYTSGHQLRSADLARAIAVEMGLPQEIIDGIRMAGSIHDLGKISIPAEILSKPTKLSEIEFALIKEHSQRGFEMLKDVESPWPLAEIIYQHHERMDGSGYPRNLKGEDICLEARILSVADTVEAMASHRPYRPGMGIDAALNEIEKNRGLFYDDAVADACLRLFREKDFTLAEA